MILELIAGLSDLHCRYERSMQIASYFGGSYFVIFVRDSEVDTLLPAPGFPQTLPDGFVWKQFLIRSQSEKFYSGNVLYPDSKTSIQATAMVCYKESLAVLIGASPTFDEVRPIKVLMPLLVTLFEQEQATIAANTKASMAEKSVVKAEKLTHTIDLMRMQLREALVKQKKDKKAIERLMELKDEFMNIASHELKTPIASMKAYLQVLARQLSASGTTGLSFIEKANKQTDKLTGLVNDLLDVNKIQAGQMVFTFTEFNFNEIICDEVSQFQISNPDYHFEINQASDIFIVADKNRLEQVVSNLISNAIKYSPQNYQIIIKVLLQGEFLRVEITDFGIGIPKEDIPYLFDRFFRVRDVAPRFSGLGLGLYISSEIIKRHGGQVGVCTEANIGSTFWFTAPVSQPMGLG